ncbi:MAG: ATP-binding protein [Lachnospiraceae bacterium]|nr:ATP-binding protein [Lachnospiraceae bacterium]
MIRENSSPPFKIAKDPCFEERLNKLNVIKLDMNSEYQNTLDKAELIKRITGKIKEEMYSQFPTVVFREDDSLAECILKVFSATGETFVIIMDEYDVLVRENVPETLFAEYLSFLNGLFKSDTLRPAISLAYLTGIFPIVRDKIQSKLNNFKEYTILEARELTEFIGFTSEEVVALCNEYGIEFEECRRWYDGYKQHGFEIYNPESVVNCIETKSFGNFWGKTSRFDVISDRLDENYEGTKEDVIKMISGEDITVDPDLFMNTVTGFKTKDEVFTYLIHLGYLAYDRETETCRIPNKEIRNEWLRAIKVAKDYGVTNRIIVDSKELLTATIDGDEEMVARALDRSHINVTSNRSYNNEDALQSAIYLAYIYALNEYTVIKEMTTGKGFADVVFIPFKENRPAMIIELKRNSCTESAIDQIKEKKYFASLEHYNGNLLFVGINYDEKEKTHTCKIEKFDKE